MYGARFLREVRDLIFSRPRLRSTMREPMNLVTERSPSNSGQSGCLARSLVLSFFARSDRPLSFVSTQVTGETTYTRSTARSRAPFAEDTQYSVEKEMYTIERLFSERRSKYLPGRAGKKSVAIGISWARFVIDANAKLDLKCDLYTRRITVFFHCVRR